MTIQPDEILADDWSALVVLQNSDANLALSFTDPVTGLAYDLTGLSISFVVKPSRYVADSQGTFYTPTIVNPPTVGQATLLIPGSDLAVIGTQWYHADILGGGGSKVSSKFGPFIVEAV